MSIAETWNMACPKCANDNSVYIESRQGRVRLTVDGCDGNESSGGYTWGKSSDADCGECGYTGTVKQFSLT